VKSRIKADTLVSRRWVTPAIAAAVVLGLLLLELVGMVSRSTTVVWLDLVVVAIVVGWAGKNRPAAVTSALVDVAFFSVAAILVVTHVAVWSTVRDLGGACVAGTVGQAMAPVLERRRLRRSPDRVEAARDRRRERLRSLPSL